MAQAIASITNGSAAMTSPRFVLVARTGNENDIIEPFVRHHAAMFDLLLVIDDDSTDGSWTILERLRDEGLPLLLFRAGETGWPQTTFTTRLMHLAFDEHGADWICALDADEFLELPAGAALADIVPATDELLIQIRWNNFAWHRTLDEAERNPVVRMQVRMPPRIDSAKAIVPRAALRGDREARLLNGNHGLYRHGERVAVAYYEQLPLCHFPIRSIQQFVSKVVINHLRYATLPNNHRPEVGFQYKKPFDLTKGSIEQMLPRIIEEMERESPVYALQNGGMMIGQIADRPLDYRGGPLLYSNRPTSALTNIIGLAERFAHRIAALEEQLGMPSGL
jgi:glycosyltransferase involved in cell wall biosynthesis